MARIKNSIRVIRMIRGQNQFHFSATIFLPWLFPFLWLRLVRAAPLRYVLILTEELAGGLPDARFAGEDFG